MSSDDQEQIPFKGEDITPAKDGCKYLNKFYFYFFKDLSVLF
jgi:hypothetical protein